MKIQCPECEAPRGEIQYNQRVSRRVTFHLDPSSGDGVGDIDEEVFESETPTEVRCSECGHEGTAEEFGLVVSTPIDALQLALDNCPIEARTIKEAIEKGWKLPSLTGLWDWMNDCMSEGDRARDAIGDLLEKAYPTDEAKWRHLAGGWVHMSADTYLNDIE